MYIKQYILFFSIYKNKNLNFSQYKYIVKRDLYLYNYRIMEWDPLQNEYVEIESSEHLEYLSKLNEEIQQHENYEQDYNDYLCSLMEDLELGNLHNLVQNARNIENIYTNWNSVPHPLAYLTMKLFIYQLKYHFFLQLNEINFQNFYVYVLKLANIIFKVLRF